MNRLPGSALCLSLSLSVAVVGAACRDSGGGGTPITGDMATPGRSDGAMIVDMPATGGDASGGDGAVAGVTSIHDIDTGAVATGKMVTISGVVIGVGNYAGKSSKGICQYEAWLQEPGAAAPSGIELFLQGAPCIGDGGTCTCPFPPKSNTVLDTLGADTLGKLATVTGKVANFQPSQGDMGMKPPVQHEVAPMTITVGAATTLAPVVIGDADIASFAKGGSGYQKYESMLVTLAPSASTAIGTVDNFGAFTYAGATVGGEYRFFYDKGPDGGTFPTTGQMFKSITGIAAPAFGGRVLPRIPADFTM